jgi:dipeptidyl aminopeptidase/acylaminoacyl peptidase
MAVFSRSSAVAAVFLLVGCGAAPAAAPATGSAADADDGSARPETAAPSGELEVFEKRFGFSSGEAVELEAEGAGGDRASAGDPFDIEALYDLRRLGGSRWGPDGDRILLSVTSYDLAAGESSTDIWLAERDGSPLRRMTTAEAADGSPRWSPDGGSLIFVAARGEEGSQLWRMPVDGGEAERLTSISTGVGDPRWSPDGKRIAFSSRVFPEHGADDEKNAALLEDIEGGPLHAHLADHLLYRHWTSWREGRRTHLLVLDLESGKISDVTPGDYESPVWSLGGSNYDWSPDGDELCFASNREQIDARAWTTNADLYAVPAGGGEALCLTPGNDGWDGAPRYSPDGRWIAFLRQLEPGYESDRRRIALYDRESGDVRVLSEGFDNQIHDYRWSADSGSIVFQAAVRGRYPLFRLEVKSGEIERVKGIPSARSFDLSARGELAFVHDAVDRPQELYLAAASGAVTRLSSFNDAVVERCELRPAEELWVEGAGGRKVHVFLVKPHGFDPSEKYPAILNVHGGPQSQWSDSFRGNWQLFPGAGYVLAFSNPVGSTGYGAEVTAGISKDWGGAVFEDVMAVADALEGLEYVDEERIGAMGWSYGGYMMNWILGQSDRFAAVASMMGIYDTRSFYASTEELWFPEWDLGGPHWENEELYERWNPSEHAEKMRTPTLIITGEKDFRIPYTQSLMLFTALRRQDVPARLIVFENDGHWPSRVKSMPLYYAAHLDWFHRWLGGEPSPYDIREMIRNRAFDSEE